MCAIVSQQIKPDFNWLLSCLSCVNHRDSVFAKVVVPLAALTAVAAVANL